MNSIATISELLQLSDSSYRIFDLGRTVSKIPKEQFKLIEQAMQPYPFPIQGHAMLAVVFWQKQSLAPYIWFVKMPLDERGLLNQAARNHFIAIILEALGNDLSQDPSAKQEELLKSNPYNFTPSQYKLASLNSIIKRDLKQSASQFYEHAQLYFAGKIGFDSWQGVAIQGISDFAARTEQKDNEAHLIAALDKLPPQVFAPLASALENHKLSYPLIERLLQLGQQELKKAAPDIAYLANILRALSGHADHPKTRDFINLVLNSKLNDLNLFITLCGRCWSAFTHSDMLMIFLEKIAATDDFELFAGIFQDMIAIPQVRPTLLQCLRNEQRSEALSKMIGQLFSHVKGNK
ncbi:DUF3549 family protein [Thalassotalea aquiviva]|uniref:DUF3549 family protein n=1 Tax=Thalassotalea aquiviva TaxID=3242415 RepID=UPI00352A296F